MRYPAASELGARLFARVMEERDRGTLFSLGCAALSELSGHPDGVHRDAVPLDLLLRAMQEDLRPQEDPGSDDYARVARRTTSRGDRAAAIAVQQWAVGAAKTDEERPRARDLLDMYRH